MGPGYAMRSILDCDETRSRDEFGSALARAGIWDDPVCSDSLLYPIEYRLVHPFRIVRRLQEVRWDAADEHRLRNILGTISSLVARDFAASHTETDKSDILEVELVEQLVKILAERIVVVASCGFAGLAEAPA